MDKDLGSSTCKIAWTILKIDKGGTQTNEPEDKKVDDNTQSLLHPMTKRNYVCPEKKEEEDLPALKRCVDPSIPELEDYIKKKTKKD